MSNEGDNARVKDAAESIGFSKISHLMSLDPRLSDGAKVTYSILLQHSQQKDWAMPGIKRLAKMRGLTHTPISEHLGQLIRAGLIVRHRRLGKSSLTTLPRLSDVYPRSYIDAVHAMLYEGKSFDPEELRALLPALAGQKNSTAGKADDCRQE